MPTQSREILTLRLVVDCQLDLVQDESNPSIKSEGREDAFTKILTGPSDCRPILEQDTRTESAPLNEGLLALPIEVRLKILRYILLFENNIQKHTRRLPSESIKHLLSLDSRRILEAPQFKHKGKQEINGVLPIYMSCNIDPAVLRVCRTLYLEGRHVLYRSNLVVAIQCGIKGLGAKFRNYGIRVWGPLQPSIITGPGEPPLPPSEESPGDVLKPACFNPVVTFRGKSSKADTPFYICSNRSLTYLVHALWILIKCPFARGMKFTVHTNPQGRQRHRRIVHGFLKFQLLPWMHNHIDKITGPGPATEDIDASKWLQHHRNASLAAPNVYTYNAVCAYLEQLLAGAEKDIEAGSYTSAETLHELVCYQACSIVRTRTGKLVDVSTKSSEGINRVCKLIAISAFRLCELRSGAVMNFRAFGSGEQKREPLQSSIDSTTACCPLLNLVQLQSRLRRQDLNRTRPSNTPF